MTDGRQNMEGAIPPNTVSVYGHGADALDDFPVLKAFQQYVDSEQAKAHKRLMSVCFFFTLLIFALAGAFFYVISDLNGKGASSEATIKALSENNATLQGQLLDQARRLNEELMSKIAAGNAASGADAELGKKNLELQMKLATIEMGNRIRAEQRAEAEKRREAEEAEKRRLAEAAEKKRAEETEARIRKAVEDARREGEEKAKAAAAAAAAAERAKKEAEDAKTVRERELAKERRRLYPEYFDEDGNEHKTPVAKRPAAPAPVQTKPPAPAPVKRAAPAPAPAPTPAKRAAAQQPQKAKPAPAKANETKFDDIDELDELLDEAAPLPPAPVMQDDGSLRFFEEDETTVDVGENSGWTIPLE